MSIRPKTKRRILYLLCGATVLGGAGTWVVHYRNARTNAVIESWKAKGVAAYKIGDYPEAINELSRYVTKRKTDAEALFDYGVARSKVPLIDGDHIAQAIGVFRRYLELVPENFEAQHLLLDLETQSQSFAGPAVNLANDILRTHPNDAQSLMALAKAQYALRHFPEALAAAKRYNEVSPKDLDGHMLTFVIMTSLNRPQKEIRKHADELAKQYPGDARFTLLRGIAYHFNRDPMTSAEQNRLDAEACTKILVEAARQDPPDAQFVKTAIPYLDAHQQIAVADDLMERASKKFDDEQINRDLIERIWQRGKYQEVVTRLASLDPNSPKADSQVIAFKALSLHSLNKNDEASALVDALSRRQNETSAYAWSVALKALFAGNAADAKAQIAAFQEAISHDGRNAVLLYMLGQAYLNVGENDLALEEMRHAAGMMPGWADVHLKIVQILLQSNKGTDPELEDQAKWVYVTSKVDNTRMKTDAVIATLLIEFEQSQASGDASRVHSLLENFAQLQNQVKNEPQTLPAYVTLLAEDGQRDKAIAVVRGALKDSNGEDVLLRLAAACRAQKLGLDQELFAACESQYGLTAKLAYARALDALQAGRADDGLKILQDGKAKAGGTKSEQWDLAFCQYYELTRDARAKDAWVALGNAYPDDLRIQTRVLLGEQSAWADRAFISQTIDRLHALTGDTGSVWKLGKAQWLLGSGDVKDAAAAANLLADLIKLSPGQLQPHRLLSEADEKLGKLTLAADEMGKAADVAPTNPVVLYNLMRLQSAIGHVEDARITFDDLAKLPNLPPSVALAAANVAAAQGDVQRAQDLLAQYPNPADPVGRDAEMARLYRMQGKINDAATIYFNLMKQPGLPPAVLRDGAEFFAAAHDMNSANKFLDQLKQAPLKPGELEIYLAQFADKFVGADAAQQQYAAASKAAPNDPAVAVARAGFYLRHGKWSDAQSYADASLNTWPGNPDLTNIRDAARTLATMPNAAQAISVADALAAAPQDPAAIDTLGVMADASKLSGTDALARLNALLQKYPKFGPAYAMTLQQLVALGRMDEAEALAQKAMDRFPDSADAARNAAQIYGMRGKWPETIAAAERWRTRSIDQPLPADLLIATGNVLTGHAKDAMGRLAPYVPDAQAKPDENVKLLTTYAEALIAADKADDAAALLHPLAERSAQWRKEWLNVTRVGFILGRKGFAAAGDWVRKVEPLVPEDSVVEHQRLSDAWFDLGTAYGEVSAYATARDELKPFLTRSDMTVPALMDLAAAASQCNDNALAETVYRRALAADASNATVQNNLAMILLGKGDPKSLAEAQQLAKAAATAKPNDPISASYFDTLARVSLKQGNLQAAADGFRSADRLMPNQIGIVIGLANVSAKLGKLDDAARYLNQADGLLSQGNGQISSDMQADLDAARQALRKPVRTPVTGADLGPAGATGGPVPR